MIRIARLPLGRIGVFVRPFVFTMAFGSIAAAAHAEDVMRKISELEPITPAMTRLNPDFETGGLKASMPTSEIMERLRTSGFTMTLRFVSKHGAGIDGKYFTTDEYDARISVFKVSEDKSRKEVLDLNFLPGQGGLASLSRHVEFRNQAGRTPMKRSELEGEMNAELGPPAVTVQKFANKARKSPNAHLLGLYCFEPEETEMIPAAECDLEKVRKDGYFYDIEVDERGDVVSLDVTYDASSYAKSYKDALYSKMTSLIENDKIWEFRVARQQP